MKKLITALFVVLTGCMPADEAERITLEEAHRDAVDTTTLTERTGPCAKEYEEADAALSWVYYCLQQQEMACTVDSGDGLDTDIDLGEVLDKRSTPDCDEWTERVQQASQAYFQKKAIADACRARN